MNLIGSRLVYAIIGGVLGPTALGIYTLVDQSLKQLIAVLVGIPNRIIMPVFARLQQSAQHLKRIRSMAISRVMLITIPLTIVCIACATLVPVILGDRWIGAVSALRWLSPLLVLAPLRQFHYSILTATNRAQWRLLFTTIEVGLRVAITALIVHAGIIYVAQVHVFVSIAVLIVIIGFVQNVLHRQQVKASVS